MVPRLFRTMAALCSAAILKINQWRAAWPVFLKSYNKHCFDDPFFYMVPHVFRHPYDTAQCSFYIILINDGGMSLSMVSHVIRMMASAAFGGHTRIHP